MNRGMYKTKMPKPNSLLPFLFPPSFLFSCFAFAVLIYDVLQKTKAQKNSVHWHHAWKGDILHIYFSYIFKNIHAKGFFFFAWITVHVWQSNTSPFILGNYSRTFCLQFLLKLPTERKRLQKSIPCSEQLWTILVTDSKGLKRSSGNVLLYNRLGPNMKQKASMDFRVWFTSQADQPNNTILRYRVPYLRIILSYPYS